MILRLEREGVHESTVFAMTFGALVTAACRRSTSESRSAPKKPKSMRGELVFITRDGCVNTPDMLLNVDDALRDLGLALD